VNLRRSEWKGDNVCGQGNEVADGWMESRWIDGLIFGCGQSMRERGNRQSDPSQNST